MTSEDCLEMEIRLCCCSSLVPTITVGPLLLLLWLFGILGMVLLIPWSSSEVVATAVEEEESCLDGPLEELPLFPSMSMLLLR